MSAWHKNCKNKLVIGFGSKCCICGYSKCIEAFDLHHIDSEDKNFNISSFKIRNWDIIKEEAKKCVLLCSNCHRELHAGLVNLPKDPFRFNEELVPKKELVKYNCQVCGIEVSHKSTTRCIKCQGESKKKFLVTKEELNDLVENHPLTFIASMYNVSDKAIQKRCEKLGIPLKGRGYWSKRRE